MKKRTKSADIKSDNNIETNEESDPKQCTIRDWLAKNKIFFETITAVLLSFMAILVSLIQTCSGSKQTELVKIQTDLARMQWEAEQRRLSIQHTADWQRLRDGIWAIYDHYPKIGTEVLDKMDYNSRSLWFKELRSLLDAQTDNPVLI